MSLISGFHVAQMCCIGNYLRFSKSCLSSLSLLYINNSCIIFDSKWTHSKRQILKNKLNEKTEKFRNSEKILSKKGKLILANIQAVRSSLKERVEAVIERENIWTVPNILCCIRIALSPYLGYLIYTENFNLAFYVMLFAGLTDVLDGFIARTFTSQSSKLGSFLDPLADKILVSTMCITLTCANLMPASLTILILSRDIALAAAGFYIRYESLPPPKTLARYFDPTHATAKLEPTAISKFNTTVQLAAVGMGLMSPVFEFTGHPYLFYLWCFTATTTIVSAGSYIYQKDTYKILTKKRSK